MAIDLSDPNELGAAADKVATLRQTISTDVTDGASDVFSQDHYLLALAALDQAASHLRLASYHQARDNASPRRGWSSNNG